jgi:uncharacterized protein YneF (UPF0154 family)
MTKDGSPGNPAGNRILGLILALLGAIAGYFLARYLMSR